MTIMELSRRIALPMEIRYWICTLEERMDFAPVDGLLPDFYNREKMKTVHTALENLWEEDPGHMKMLAAMLYASAAAYDRYQEKKIPDEIYNATMKCYTRFLRETWDRTGAWEFDRYWWTARQAGCHLFRIGELEYEIKQAEGRDVIGIHIPSDADFSPEAVDASLRAAEEFFEKYFPEYAGCDYICHSWLLDQQLTNWLKKDSNIVQFQKRFSIYDPGEAEVDFLRWIFCAPGVPYADLPERTSLQRKVKHHLLEGKTIYNSYGKLR